MTTFLSHLSAAYCVLAAPWLGIWWYQRARKRIAAGAPDAKVRMYRETVAEQIVTAAVVLAIWRGGQIPAAALGLSAPRSWALSLAVLLPVVGALVWSSLQLRPKAEKIRKKLQNSIGALLPESKQERFWFGAISVGAGISEELAFRGFLLFYFSLYLPHLNTFEKMLLTALVFGLAHIYQGWKPAIGTGVLGLILAGLYLWSGSLLLPVLIHAAVDWRVLLIFPPPSPSSVLITQSQA
jgi:membrane protease YdiL (CAAX protease family)